MNPLYTVAQIREVERLAAAGQPEGMLMERAGRAAAAMALDLLPFATPLAQVLVLAGPGNNGGDAFEVAAHLANSGAHVSIIHVPPGGATAPERDRAFERARASPAHFVDLAPEAIAAGAWNLVVDGLFGIGLQRPLDRMPGSLVDAVNALACPVLALDVPSGLDADTGCVVGPHGRAVNATHTVTFIGDKPGLHTCDGRDHAGDIMVADLALAPALFPPAAMHLNDPAFFARQARTRRHNSHKGSYGNVFVLGGAPGMAGAPVLAGRAALHAGAGRVYLCFAGEPLVVDAGQPELMCRAARDVDYTAGVTVAGPGLGGDAEAARLLASAVASHQPLLLDADALNLLAADPSLLAAVAQRGAATLATPHPLEAARLLDTPVGTVQADRLAAARTLAGKLNACVVLKGSGTVIAAPDGRLVINQTGNAGLATAGTGDVLAGLAGALLAQGWPGWEAALAAVWLHGIAADMLVAEGAGPIGLTAGELIPTVRVALNRLVAQQRDQAETPHSR
ncbi:NAD(P)H-hydrate dehydratase [Pseudoduganella albidiflava]|uniref:Bifunctional NAD(P)H-hydrate repair enzyme n=1 Tax=Pseudoduganella albidiflava TaxID=321983 RepID=A0A411WY27_9BURK|nr:NAD(P)H-hydrate dehydratase [Pseudoduganella albidiflava]QBI01600.1 NAD(P)H-hydrate dehydratase [Pseudoduganella albidiflava]GGY34379.1 bifunctional NAD(P)H-hydrate repair enzyme [Pseudoduganella albidiflava]